MTVLEALALRKPVIAGVDTPGMIEMLENGRGGVLVNVRASGTIAAAMLTLANDVSERIRMGQSGFNRAQTHYRLGTILARYEDQYRGVLRG